MSACVITIVLAYASEPKFLVVDICAALTHVHALQASAVSVSARLFEKPSSPEFVRMIQVRRRVQKV
jgi:hypothetical protein